MSKSAVPALLAVTNLPYRRLNNAPALHILCFFYLGCAIQGVNTTIESNSERPVKSVRDPLLGTRLDARYDILSLLGKGASGSVYKAEEVETHRLVAIKAMHEHLLGDTSMVERFEREAKTAKILQHANIASVYEYHVSQDGTPYLVMEYVEGTSLSEIVFAAGWLPVHRGLTIFSQVCAALGAAHERGVVHRDLKPGNIMLSAGEDGQLLVKVLDFGIAKVLPVQGDTVMKLTQTGEMLGSLLYMSPEQCLDLDVDERSDCYSLGCVMYEALTGKPPLVARTAFETMNKQISEMPEELSKVRPDVVWPRGLQEVIFKCMAKDTANRYQSISDLQDDLKKLLEGGVLDFPGAALSRVATVSAAAASHTALSSAAQATATRLTIVPDQAALKQVVARIDGNKTAIKVWTVLTVSFLVVNLALVLSGFLDSKYIGLIFFLGLVMMVVNGSLIILRRMQQRNLSAMLESAPESIKIVKFAKSFDGASTYRADILLSDGLTARSYTLWPFQFGDTLWGSLCTASQLESLNVPQEIFPLEGRLYRDLNGQAFVIQIGDQMAQIYRS